MIRNKENFFPGVEFRLPQPALPPETPSAKREVQMEPGKLYSVDDFLKENVSDEVDMRYLDVPWTQRGILYEYRSTLVLIGGDIGTVLPRQNRYVHLVPRRALVPKDPREREKLISRYGPYILDTIIGSTKRSPDGKFSIRLGFAGKESVVPRDQVQEVNSHEYGHTLGFHIDDPVFEEMKAYAFEALFMRHYLDVGSYEMDGTNPNQVHDIAASRVGQLQARGVREEEIIAHLIQQRFGNFGPNDYRRHVGRRFLRLPN